MSVRTIPRLTAIGSGKGGTGKTLVATALAWSLAHEGERVLLCDADLGLSNATVHLGLDSGGDFSGVLSNRTQLGQAVVPVLGGAGRGGGFDLLAAPSGSGALANLDPSVAERMIAKLRDSRIYDRVVLDLSAGVDATTMAFAARADETVLVLTPDPAALMDAYAFMKLLLRLGAPKPLSLANMVASEAEGRRTHEALTRTCLAFLKIIPDCLGSVPRDPHVLSAVRQQRLLPALYPHSAASRALEAIAHALSARGPLGQTVHAALTAR
ncbi:MAG: P-loop NTPase [Rhizomicrobium sp.]